MLSTLKNRRPRRGLGSQPDEEGEAPFAGVENLGMIGDIRLDTLGSDPLAHQVWFGPAGAGKTANLARQIVTTPQGANIVVAGVGTDLLQILYRDLVDQALQRGGEVYVYDPMGVGTVPTVGWNPTVGCLESPTDNERASILVGLSERWDRNGDDHSIWTRYAVRLLAPLLHLAAWQGNDFAWLLDVVARRDIEAVLSELRRIVAARPGYSDARMHLSYLESGRGPQAIHVGGTVWKELHDALAIWSNVNVLKSTAGRSFDTAGFLNGHDNVLFVLLPPDRPDSAPSIAFLDQLRRAAVDEAEAREDHRLKTDLYVYLDDAGHAPLTDLAAWYEKGRGWGHCVTTVWHTLGEAQHGLGRQAAEAVLARAHFQLWFRTTDPVGLDYLAKVGPDEPGNIGPDRGSNGPLLSPSFMWMLDGTGKGFTYVEAILLLFESGQRRIAKVRLPKDRIGTAGLAATN
jgi:type IV secretory pathway TraG/TraD family ATPase VirD4